jgi:hypothetical protein
MNTTPTGPGPQGEPTEEELRAALEEQLRHVSAADVIVQAAVSLINLAGRRLGLAPGSEGERDLGQVRDAIDAVRALLPVLERGEDPETLTQLRGALSALQIEYTKLSQVAPAQPSGGSPPSEPPADGGAASETPAKPAAGPAQSSGRLWVPGSSGR